MRVVLCCKCGDTPQYSLDAFATLFPDLPTPELVAGDSAIASFADTLAPSSEAANYVRGLSHNKEKFSLYFDIDDETGGLNQVTNLLTGRRVA